MVEERGGDALQEVVDQAPAAVRYFSDGFTVYPTLMYAPGEHQVGPGKSQTCSVERGQCGPAPLPGPPRQEEPLLDFSRCFSCCLEALRRALALFVYCYNARQLWHRAHPNSKAAIIDFLPLLTETLLLDTP